MDWLGGINALDCGLEDHGFESRRYPSLSINSYSILCPVTGTIDTVKT